MAVGVLDWLSGFLDWLLASWIATVGVLACHCWGLGLLLLGSWLATAGGLGILWGFAPPDP